MMTRRSFLAAGTAAALSACTQSGGQTTAIPSRSLVVPVMPDFYGAMPDEPYPVQAVPEGVVAPSLWRQAVPNPFPEDPVGTIIVDPDAGCLHFVENKVTAIRYGAGTGAAAFAWSGEARLQFCRAWPRWKVPEEMVARQPDLAPYSVAKGGMQPGPGNPLGARALYLFQGGQDTLYRIHGACEPEFLGKQVSSGCIRLLDQDVIDLHQRARHGATVKVLASLRPTGLPMVY